MYQTGKRASSKRASRWLLLAVLVAPLLLGGCSIANLPVARNSGTAGSTGNSSNSNGAPTSPTPASSSQQLNEQATPRTEPTARPTQASLPAQQGGTQGGAPWQVPAEQ